MPAEADPLLKLLLENLKSTTELLELLSGTALAAQSCNSVRNSLLYRSSVLIGNRSILVFARAGINLSLLSRQACRAILEGTIPLGRILLENGIKTSRGNFKHFVLRDIRFLTAAFRPLSVGSPAYRKWLVQHHYLLTGRTDPREFYPDPYHKFPGRSYGIYLQNRQLAWIEEIFPPDLSHNLRL